MKNSNISPLSLLSPERAKWSEKEIELAQEVNDLIDCIRRIPDERWKTCDFWYELVVACHQYKKHWDKQYRKGGIR